MALFKSNDKALDFWSRTSDHWKLVRLLSERHSYRSLLFIVNRRIEIIERCKRVFLMYIYPCNLMQCLGVFVTQEMSPFMSQSTSFILFHDKKKKDLFFSFRLKTKQTLAFHRKWSTIDRILKNEGSKGGEYEKKLSNISRLFPFLYTLIIERS